jgi:DNA topoisomerase I
MATHVDSNSSIVADGIQAAESAGLFYATDDDLQITRKAVRGGFSYATPNGRVVRDRALLKRIRALAIPPAWTDVRICPDPNGHLQATGRDAKGRKQYRYHPHWRDVRDSTKYEHILTFAHVLPKIRKRIREDMSGRSLSHNKVLATVVYLLENTLIRVGNSDYAKQNKSYGLTTLCDRHADIIGDELRFEFKGKSGKTWRLRLRDRRIARIVKACQSIPGQHLFQYFDGNGDRHPVTSSDVNAYLHEITGSAITAKDFRTWAGTVLTAMALREIDAFDSDAKAKRNVREAIGKVAARLGNTPSICRKCYVHPEILNCYFEGSRFEEIARNGGKEPHESMPSLEPEEAAVLALLQRRLTREIGSRHQAAA